LEWGRLLRIAWKQGDASVAAAYPGERADSPDHLDDRGSFTLTPSDRRRDGVALN